MPTDLAARLAVFVDAGLVPRVPTPWQLFQAEVQMTPYVISTDATCEPGYAGKRLGHPILRQPIIFTQVGLDHLRTGSGLGARLGSLITHLHLTFHQGMPVFDLQVVQTHTNGLAVLRRRTEELLLGATAHARRTRRIAGLILDDPATYHARFLGPDGWIARAEAFDYPAPADEGSRFPPEFFSLVGLVNHAAAGFPAQRPPRRQLPALVARLASRRFLEARTSQSMSSHAPQ